MKIERDVIYSLLFQNGNVLMVSENELEAEKYHYEVILYDENGNPTEHLKAQRLCIGDYYNASHIWIWTEEENEIEYDATDIYEIKRIEKTKEV